MLFNILFLIQKYNKSLIEFKFAYKFNSISIQTNLNNMSYLPPLQILTLILKI
jgi:hypothetical protein